MVGPASLALMLVKIEHTQKSVEEGAGAEFKNPGSLVKISI